MLLTNMEDCNKRCLQKKNEYRLLTFALFSIS